MACFVCTPQGERTHARNTGAAVAVIAAAAAAAVRLLRFAAADSELSD